MAEQEIRTILAPLDDGHLLLPNSAVAEVLAYKQPEPFRKAPNWLLGEIAWHGWQVPIICLEQLINKKHRNSVTPKSRILVIKTLGESTQVNYIGLLIQGLPRLKTVTPKNLGELATDDLPDALFSRVSIDDLEAVIPELSELTLAVEQAAYGS
ncbi:MAG: chemotaxis protein CheW [Xanthomonadales bacterium]|nr:chemotaxis protein CheW [Xanthomonadales bacterium]